MTNTPNTPNTPAPSHSQSHAPSSIPHSAFPIPHSPSPAHGRLWTRWGFDPGRGVLDGICLEWRDGIITQVEPSPRPPRDLPATACFDHHLLTPGLLNAHAHLDWSFRRGVLPRGRGFAPWLGEMIAANRRLADEDETIIRQAVQAGLAELIQSGVTEVWDVSSPGWARPALRASGLRAISFAEFLALRRAAWPGAWDAWRQRFELEAPAWEAPADEFPPQGQDGAARLRTGVSPHTPYTLCPPALEASVAFARGRRLPLAIHLAESPEENELLLEGRGRLHELFSEMFGFDVSEELDIGRSPIRRAAEAGALTPATLAIHANLPQPGEIHQLAASGAVAVFCPRSHAFFGYPHYPLAAYRAAGVRLALGTDSLASNDSLDLRAEVHAFARLADQDGGGWRPAEILAVATGAALGDEPPYGGRGRLAAGQGAQWALWQLDTAPAQPNPETLLERWLAPVTRLAASSALL